MKEKGNIYFVRHGQTDRNIKGIMNPGDVDSILNSTGIIQAKNAGKLAKKEGIIFDIIISSPLKRAFNTAKLIAKEIGYKGDILTDKRLEEQYAGVLKDYSHTQIKSEFNVDSTIEIRKIFKCKKYNKAEDILDFKDRVTDIFNEIKNIYSEKNILIVGHSGVSRIIFMNSENIDFEKAVYEMNSTPNATIIKLDK